MMDELPIRSANYPFGRQNAEAKLCVIIDSKAPVVIRKNEDPHQITLGRFKYLTALQDDCYKFYFKSEDSEFGEVKEEITEEDSPLPVDERGQIVAWVTTSYPSPTHRMNLMQAPPRPTTLRNYGQSYNQFSSRPYPPPRPAPLNLHNLSAAPAPSYDNLPVPDQFNTNSSSSNSYNGNHLSAPTQRPPLPPRPRERLESQQHQQNGSRLSGETTNSLPRSTGQPRFLYNSFNSFVDLTTASQQAQQETRLTYDEPSTPTSICNFDLTRRPNLHQKRDSIFVIYSIIKVDRESLDVKDREWLKVTFKDTLLGSSLVSWLSKNVKGFRNKSETKRFAAKFLELGLIKNVMESKEDIKFSGHRLYKLT